MADQTNVVWYQRAGIWLGLATSPGALVVGGGLGAQLPINALFFVIPLGALILTALTVTQGIVSRRRRETLPQRADHTFGSGGGFVLFNLVMVLSTIGWVSFYMGIAGYSLAILLNLSGWLGVFLLTASVLALGELKLNRWNFLVWITNISALGAAAVALNVVEPKPIQPTAPNVGLMMLIWGVGSVIAYSSAFAARCPDFTWDMAGDLEIVKDGATYFGPVIIMLGIGVTLYQRTGEWNLADILAQTPSAGLGHLFLVLAVISPVMTNFHSATIALQSLVPVSRRQGYLFFAVFGFIFGATRFDRQLLPFLDVLGATMIPLLIVMLLSVIPNWPTSKRVALVAWLCGSATAILFKWQGQLIHLVAGAAVSLLSFYLMDLIMKRLNTVPSGPQHG